MSECNSKHPAENQCAVEYILSKFFDQWIFCESQASFLAKVRYMPLAFRKKRMLGRGDSLSSAIFRSESSLLNLDWFFFSSTRYTCRQRRCLSFVSSISVGIWYESYGYPTCWQGNERGVVAACLGSGQHAFCLRRTEQCEMADGWRDAQNHLLFFVDGRQRRLADGWDSQGLFFQRRQNVQKPHLPFSRLDRQKRPCRWMNAN